MLTPTLIFGKSFKSLLSTMLVVSPTLREPRNFTVDGTALKEGDYKVEIQGDMAVFTKGSKTFQLPAKLDKASAPYASTVFVSQRSKLIEIDLGGTTDKIIFHAAGK